MDSIKRLQNIKSMPKQTCDEPLWQIVSFLTEKLNNIPWENANLQKYSAESPKGVFICLITITHAVMYLKYLFDYAIPPLIEESILLFLAST